jgi:hypothetical protein
MTPGNYRLRVGVDPQVSNDFSAEATIQVR